MTKSTAIGMVRVLFSRIASRVFRRHAESELEAELRAHLDLLIEANLRKGMTLEEARAAARREFGGVEQTKEIYREQAGFPFAEGFACAWRRERKLRVYWE